MSIEATCVIDAKATLGEGPIWDSKSKRLYWVDILNSQLFIYDPVSGENEAHDLGEHVGTVVPRKMGGVAVALVNGFAAYDPIGRRVEYIAKATEDDPNIRFNDGKCDPAGRFFAGTLGYDGAKGAGKLYRLDPDYSLHIVQENISCSNGLVWTSDNQTMYYIDTPTRTVDAFDYDLDSGAISNRRVAFEIPESEGYPDGMTIDSEDNLWVAKWGGHQVVCWNPKSGEILERITIPAPNVTACAFSGENLEDLYITTARSGLNDEQIENEPQTGGLFKATPGAHGVPAFAFAG